MQEQTLFREKYNFAKFEWRRIRSLWGLLGKDKAAQNDEDITVWQMLKRIFAEIRGAAWRPFVKVIVLTVVCGCLSGIGPYTKMLYMGRLPGLLSGVADAIMIFAIFLALDQFVSYLWQIFYLQKRFANSEFTDVYGTYAEARDYADVLHKPRALLSVNGAGALLSFARSIQGAKENILRNFFYLLGEVTAFSVCVVSLSVIAPGLLLFMLFVQYVNIEFLLYNNDYFRKVDNRFWRFNEMVVHENAQAIAQAGLVQEAGRIAGESRRVFQRLTRSRQTRRYTSNIRDKSEKLVQIILGAIVMTAVGYVAVTDILRTGDIGRLALISGAALQVRGRLDSMFFQYLGIDRDKNRIIDLQKYLMLPKALERVTGAEHLSAEDNSITLNNVCFAYPKLKRAEDRDYLTAKEYGEPVLDNLSAVIRPGGITVIAGVSGQGKTTLVSLIRHDYDVSSGEIFIGGKEVRELSDEEINRQIAFINQRVSFFDTTIRHNLAYMCPNATDEQIAEAVEAAGLTGDIAGFDDGLKRRIGVGGSKLSGGQRQRLALARMFLTDKPIIILDEPTTGLDQGLSFKIMKKLKELAKTKNVLLVTHNPTEIALADRILVIHGGKIVADGEAQELVKTSVFLQTAMTEQDVVSKRKLFVAHCAEAA